MIQSRILPAAALALAAGVVAFVHAPSRDAVAQGSATYVNAVDLDIAPDQIGAYMAAIKENGAASIKEPACHQFSIAVQAANPNHVFLYEVYENEAALKSHRETDHFKKYAAITAKMVVERKATPLTAVAFNLKP
jgi:(4S)-4-hydroxy-5-phosphonooxypentane-2,3-dione isomerase